MARPPATTPLTQALDTRIRAIVEETMSGSFDRIVRDVVREELARSLGSVSGAGGGTGGAGRTREVSRPAGKAAPAPAAAPVASRRAAPGEDKNCNVVGCPNSYRSQGYCAAHYQAARKYGWPMPAPKNYNPPPRPARGRPPKDRSPAKSWA